MLTAVLALTLTSCMKDEENKNDYVQLSRAERSMVIARASLFHQGKFYWYHDNERMETHLDSTFVRSWNIEAQSDSTASYSLMVPASVLKSYVQGDSDIVKGFTEYLELRGDLKVFPTQVKAYYDKGVVLWATEAKSAQLTEGEHSMTVTTAHKELEFYNSLFAPTFTSTAAGLQGWIIVESITVDGRKYTVNRPFTYIIK